MHRIHLGPHSGVVEILFQRLLDEGELFFLREEQPRVDETIMFAVVIHLWKIISLPVAPFVLAF